MSFRIKAVAQLSASFLNRETMKKIIIALGAICLSLQFFPASGFCSETNVSAAAYLAMQPIPNFKPDHHLPHLTRWGWSIPFNTGSNWPGIGGMRLNSAGIVSWNNSKRHSRIPTATNRAFAPWRHPIPNGSRSR